MRFDCSKDEWALLEPLKGRMSVRVDDRKITNVIFYVLRTGMPWRDARRCDTFELPRKSLLSAPNLRLLQRSPVL
jgi:transposase